MDTTNRLSDKVDSAAYDLRSSHQYLVKDARKVADDLRALANRIESDVTSSERYHEVLGEYEPEKLAETVQHTLLWGVPNTGVHYLTSRARSARVAHDRFLAAVAALESAS